MKNLNVFKMPPEDFKYVEQGLGINYLEFKNSKILLTGASGFFGTLLLEFLVWLNTAKLLNMQIYVVVRNKLNFTKIISPWLANQIRIIEGDLTIVKIPRNNYKYIIHLASEQILSTIPSSFCNHMSNSVLSAINLMKLAEKCETESILFTSSGAVYSDYINWVTPDNLYKENFKSLVEIMNEKVIYSETKRYLELLFLTSSASSRFKVKIARCFSFIGPFLPLTKNYAIGNFIYNALNGQDIVINGDGTPLRSYLYTSDLVIYLLLILLIIQVISSTILSIKSYTSFRFKISGSFSGDIPLDALLKNNLCVYVLCKI